jgi:uncharacterized protein
VNEDTLFLAVAARLKLDQYQPVIDWFRRSILFVQSSRLGGLRDVGLARFIERSERNRAKFLDLARVADVGISGVAVEYVDDPRLVEKVEMLQAMTERLEGRLMDAGDESRDDLVNELARVRSRKALREHPLLVRKLVGLFRDPMVNVGRAQLLFTTHDAFLLAPIAGEPGLDRDQVWFVEKHVDGASELYPLADFKPRNEYNLARRYLGGSYGAIPVLDGFDSLVVSTSVE